MFFVVEKLSDFALGAVFLLKVKNIVAAIRAIDIFKRWKDFLMALVSIEFSIDRIV